MSEPVDDDLEKARRQREVERIIQHRAELYVEMSKTQAFTEFQAEMSRKEARLKEEIYATIWAEAPVNQREVDVRRGFIDGLRYIDTVISAAERKLARLDADSEPASEPDDERAGDWD